MAAMRIQERNLLISFGDITTSYVKHSLQGHSQADLLARPQLVPLSAKNIIILNQTHSIDGYSVARQIDAQLRPYTKNGDYIITDQPDIALAVETADCAPVIFASKRTLAVVHAGWRGARNGIITCVLGNFITYGDNIQDIDVFIGPTARSCCYRVQQDFINQFPDGNYFIKRGNDFYFDLVTFIIQELIKAGIARHRINDKYATCTICSEQYCSYRRQRSLNLRTMTVAVLLAA